MHSSAYFDIVDEAITNKIYEEAGVVIYGGLPGTLGKPVLVTDTAPADVIFGLLPNAVTDYRVAGPGFRSYEVNDEENLSIGYRAEGTVNIDVLGYSWKDHWRFQPNPGRGRLRCQLGQARGQQQGNRRRDDHFDCDASGNWRLTQNSTRGQRWPPWRNTWN